MNRNRRKLTLLTVALVTVLATIACANAQAVTDEELLGVIDEARFLESPYVSEVMQIVAIRPGDEGEMGEVQISYRMTEDEPFRLRLDFLAPGETVGQSYLILDDENGTVLLCTPDLEMPLTISGGTDVYGDSTVSTIAGIQFSDQYTVVARSEEILGEATVMRVDVRGTSLGLAYPTATVWVDCETLLPLQVEVYALSGDSLSRIKYEEYAELDGDQYLVKQTIENLILEGFATTLTIAEISTEPLAQELLDPETFCRPK